MKILKKIIYTLLGLLLTGAVALVGIILFAEYSGRRFQQDEAVTASATLTDDKSRLVYDENGNLAELPASAPAEATDGEVTSEAASDPASTTPADPAADTASQTATDSLSTELTAAVTDTNAEASPVNTGSVNAGSDTPTLYIMDMGSGIFHTADCPYAENITPENRVERTATRQQVVDAAYTPCTNCNP